MEAKCNAQDGYQLMVKLYLGKFTVWNNSCNQLNIHSLYPELTLQYSNR